MSYEPTLVSALAGLVANRVYADQTPDVPEFPLIIYQQVGGQAGWYVEKAMPDHKHARVQINVWAKSRSQASTLARQVEAAMCALDLPTQPYGAFTALYENDLKIYGTRQDFGLWYKS